MKNDDTGLYIVATPIGNLSDISERAIKALETCNFIICENPKHSLKLLNKFGIKKKLISLHDYNEEKIIKVIAKKLSESKVALISDAGSPLISDPGFKLINYCIKNKIMVTTVPGPSSLISALQLSGIPINQFFFAGFFPKTNKQIISFLEMIGKKNETSVFFVSGHKLKICLKYLTEKIKDREISLVKEITKINEKVFRGLSEEIILEMNDNESNFKGEFVIIVEGKTLKKTNSLSLDNYKSEINLLLSKFSLTDVVEIVHKLTGIKKNITYKWVLNLKKS